MYVKQLKRNKISSARIKYLKLIHTLDPENNGLKSIELSKELNVTRTSVHDMIEKLEELGYVEKQFYGLIYLTEQGLEVIKGVE